MTFPGRNCSSPVRYHWQDDWFLILLKGLRQLCEQMGLKKGSDSLKKLYLGHSCIVWTRFLCNPIVSLLQILTESNLLKRSIVSNHKIYLKNIKKTYLVSICVIIESLKGRRTWKFFVCSLIHVKISIIFFRSSSFSRIFFHVALFNILLSSSTLSMSILHNIRIRTFRGSI